MEQFWRPLFFRVQLTLIEFVAMGERQKTFMYSQTSKLSFSLILQMDMCNYNAQLALFPKSNIKAALQCQFEDFSEN